MAGVRTRRRVLRRRPVQCLSHCLSGCLFGVFCGIERLTVQAIGVVTACIVVFFIAHAQDRSQTIKHGDDNNQQDEVNEIDDALL